MKSHYEIANELKELGYEIRMDEETAGDESRSVIWRETELVGEILGDADAKVELMGAREDATLREYRDNLESTVLVNCSRCGGFVPAGTGVVCQACLDGDGGPM